MSATKPTEVSTVTAKNAVVLLESELMVCASVLEGSLGDPVREHRFLIGREVIRPVRRHAVERVIGGAVLCKGWGDIPWGTQAPDQVAATNTRGIDEVQTFIIRKHIHQVAVEEIVT